MAESLPLPPFRHSTPKSVAKSDYDAAADFATDPADSKAPPPAPEAPQSAPTAPNGPENPEPAKDAPATISEAPQALPPDPETPDHPDHPSWLRPAARPARQGP